MKPYEITARAPGLLGLARPRRAPPARPLPHFRAVEIDSKIEIGYAVTVADVDGDWKPDIRWSTKNRSSGIEIRAGRSLFSLKI